MLKTNLMRVKISADRALRPAYVSETNYAIRKRAQAAIDIFAANIGRTRRELEEQLVQFTKAGGALKINKGLVELLYGYSTFQSDSPVPAHELRTLLFEYGARHFPLGAGSGGPSREQIFRKVAERFSLDARDLERLMFSDLKEEQLLEDFDTPTPLDLLRRYNVALAQGILLHATGLDVVLHSPEPQRLRQLFRFLKFFRLLFTPEFGDERVAFHVDGPLSILEQTKSYGVRLASFLPALLLLDDFVLTAQVKWKRKRCRLNLTPGDGLQSHYRDRGSWVPDELSQFMSSLRKAASPDISVGESAALFSLGGRDVYVPDLVLSSGKRDAFVEVFWPWRRIGWSRYYGHFRKYAPPNAFIVMSNKCISKTDRENTSDPRIIFFRVTPLAEKTARTIREFFSKPQLPSKGTEPEE